MAEDFGKQECLSTQSLAAFSGPLGRRLTGFQPLFKPLECFQLTLHGERLLSQFGVAATRKESQGRL